MVNMNLGEHDLFDDHMKFSNMDAYGLNFHS